MPLELIFRPVDVPEPPQRIRAQGEAEAGPVRRMHHAIRTDVEWLVEELPHHRHVALAHLENVAVGGCHRNVNACGKQNSAARGIWGETPPCAEVSAAIRRISVTSPARATSGCAISSARRSSRSPDVRRARGAGWFHRGRDGVKTTGVVFISSESNRPPTMLAP